jgi:hypothetical protein
VARRGAGGDEQERRGVVDAVLELMVRSVLAGVKGVVVVRWVLGRVAAVLEFVVELGLFFIHGPAS